VTLLADLDAFLQEHRRCGDLDEVDRVWMTCVLARREDRARSGP